MGWKAAPADQRHGHKTAATATTTAFSGLPETFQAKEQRIANLPYFLNSFQPGRHIPPDTMQDIQLNLQELAGDLHTAPSSALNGFNLTLRHALPYNTLSQDTAKLLSHAFSVVLVQAGADPTNVQRLTSDMNKLAQVDSKSINPSYLAQRLLARTSDSPGRGAAESRPPRLPQSAPKDGKNVEGGKAGYTYQHSPADSRRRPTSVGATTDASTRMWILHGNEVIAVGTVEKNGRYTAQVTTPLADGVYKLQVRAVDQFGHMSRPSQAYTLKVDTKA